MRRRASERPGDQGEASGGFAQRVGGSLDDTFIGPLTALSIYLQSIELLAGRPELDRNELATASRLALAEFDRLARALGAIPDTPS
jgi:hypothetical protein